LPNLHWVGEKKKERGMGGQHEVRARRKHGKVGLPRGRFEPRSSVSTFYLFFLVPSPALDILFLFLFLFLFSFFWLACFLFLLPPCQAARNSFACVALLHKELGAWRCPGTVWPGYSCACGWRRRLGGGQKVAWHLTWQQQPAQELCYSYNAPRYGYCMHQVV
jgi:hypothetical protein